MRGQGLFNVGIHFRLVDFNDAGMAASEVKKGGVRLLKSDARD